MIQTTVNHYIINKRTLLYFTVTHKQHFSTDEKRQDYSRSTIDTDISISFDSMLYTTIALYDRIYKSVQHSTVEDR